MGKKKKLDIKTILDLFENTGIRDDALGECYTFGNEKGDYLELYVWGNNELRFLHDNFPLPRRLFFTNIPYYSIEEFENDLKRMNIDIPKRNLTKGTKD